MLKMIRVADVATMVGVCLALAGCAVESAPDVVDDPDKRSDDFCEIYAAASLEQQRTYEREGCSFSVNDTFPEDDSWVSASATPSVVWSVNLRGHEAHCNDLPDASRWRNVLERRYRALHEQCGQALPPYIAHRDGLVADSPNCADYLFPDSGCAELYGEEYSCFEGPFGYGPGKCGVRSGQGGLCYNNGFWFNDNADCEDGLTCVLPADNGQRVDGTCR